jgi:hypothetical protein
VVGVAAAAEGQLPPAVEIPSAIPTERSALSLVHAVVVVAAAIPAVQRVLLARPTIKTHKQKSR